MTLFRCKPYRELEHTADLRLEIRGTSWRGLLRNAAYALIDTITEPQTVEPATPRTIAVQANCGDELLVEFLKKINLLFQEEQFLVRKVRLDEVKPREVRATVWGETFAPDRHPLKTEIKAVTYHQLEAKRTWCGWRARVIFDI